MKKIFVIGSTVVDMIINVDHLPTTKADIHISSQTASMGGCAYNVSDTIRNFGTPNVLFSPVGSGIYGDFVRSGLRKKGLISPIPPVDMDNGCCYCFVEESGERTFVSYHGAEYLIQSEWLEEIEVEDVHSVYICGLEIEEHTGVNIVKWLEKHPQLPVFFAPGPRIMRIEESLLQRIYKLNPVMHLNDDEIKEYFATEDVESAMVKMYEMTQNTVIVTLGDKGAAWYDGNEVYTAPAVKVDTVVDTIGAGDSHVGAVMAGLYNGKTMEQAIVDANKVAAAVVGVKGALLTQEEFDAVMA
ncbi:MAG: bifunctional hydroxymethylpyrimidine kinase/phosphomethylpyrimidine kinase [Oscillospiraceae bacterium]|nr:bifunctional hydroxymethylpyrimidine kinase/phosphomethylpyrimidine kinase [Oscillospiraceae bacterium]MBR6608996.1 bifunctional hydroxymethylpyrimidine kinase/phosphomethylpyrimidine kinase [Oscillospiraceae bacterium]